MLPGRPEIATPASALLVSLELGLIPIDIALTSTVLRTIIDNLGCGGGIRAVLVGTVSDSIEKVDLGAETDRINAATKVVGLVQHVGDTDLL